MIIQRLDIRGLNVQVVRKAIKNVYLSLRSSEGEVRLSVPVRVSDAQIRQIIDDRFNWIMRKKEEIRQRSPMQPMKMVSGECHFLFGRRYVLDIHHREGRPGIRLIGDGVMQLCIRSGADRDVRLQVLREWYREQLKIRVGPLVLRWQQRLGVEVTSWNVKRMKTRWGSCNVRARRIWLNLTLAQYPEQCLEYILVHELAHLLERRHTPRFHGLMDAYLPDWQSRDQTLKNLTGVLDLHR